MAEKQSKNKWHTPAERIMMLGLDVYKRQLWYSAWDNCPKKESRKKSPNRSV